MFQPSFLESTKWASEVFTNPENVYDFGSAYISSLLGVMVNRARTVRQAEVLSNSPPQHSAAALEWPVVQEMIEF